MSLIVCCGQLYSSTEVTEETTKDVGVRGRFGFAVKSQRHRLGISQEELAWRAGLHRTYVADIERGARNPSLESIHKLSRALGSTIATIFGSTEGRLPVEFASRRTASIVSPRKTILLVEENKSDVDVTLTALRQAAVMNSVYVVHDGADAIDYLFCKGRHTSRRAEEQPQMILLNLKLPKISGLEVLRQVRGNSKTKEIPLVILTHLNKESDIRKAKRLGARAHIVKPVSFEKVLQVTPQLKLGWLLLECERNGANFIVNGTR